MNGFVAVFKRELKSYFATPIAYVFLVIFLFFAGYLPFRQGFYDARQADLRLFFTNLPLLFVFMIPCAAMRLWAEERRSGSIELLLTLPVTVIEVILGKFLAAWCFIGIALLLTFPLVLTVIYLGNPDLGVIFCAYVGSLLMAGAFLSVGSMTSALTRSQVVSFILAVVACLFLILAGFAPVTAALSGWAPLWLVDLVSGTSVLSHFSSIARGVLDVRDLFYFLSVMTVMIFINGVILQNRESA